MKRTPDGRDLFVGLTTVLVLIGAIMRIPEVTHWANVVLLTAIYHRLSERH